MDTSRIAELIDLPRALDMDSRYDDMLDECYSFEDVGGPFASMLPSNVLSECDPVAYRCGFNDWIDGELGESCAEFEGEYYDLEALRDCVQEAIDSLEADASGVDDDDIPDSSIADDIELLNDFLCTL